MATQILASPVVSFPVPHHVCQSELAHILELRRQREGLDERIKEAEGVLRTALEAGASVQEGIHVAALKESFRRNIAWREVAERLGDRLYGDGKGEGYCEKVLQSTKPTRTVSLTIM